MPSGILTEGGLYLASGGRVPAANTYNADDVVNAFLSGAENLFDADSTKAVLITPHDNYAAPSITTKNAELTDIINEELEAIYTGSEDRGRRFGEHQDARRCSAGWLRQVVTKHFGMVPCGRDEVGLSCPFCKEIPVWNGEWLCPDSRDGAGRVWTVSAPPDKMEVQRG